MKPTQNNQSVCFVLEGNWNIISSIIKQVYFPLLLMHALHIAMNYTGHSFPHNFSPDGTHSSVLEMKALKADICVAVTVENWKTVKRNTKVKLIWLVFSSRWNNVLSFRHIKHYTHCSHYQIMCFVFILLRFRPFLILNSLQSHFTTVLLMIPISL